MSTFSSLMDIADNDVKVVVGESDSKKEEALLVAGADLRAHVELLDDAESRNQTAIDIATDTEVAVESGDLSKADIKILNATLQVLTGNRRRAVIAHESVGEEDHRSLAQEAIKDTLKSFWKFIKDAVVKFYNILKTWWYKTFDISKRLKKRADKLYDRAEKETGFAQENDFIFSEAGRLAVEGKYNNPVEILQGVDKVEKICEEFLEPRTADQFNDTVQNLSDHVELVIGKIKTDTDLIIKTGQKTDENFKVDRGSIKLTTADIKRLLEIATNVSDANKSDLVNDSTLQIANQDKYMALYAEKTDEFHHSAPLPGGKWIISVNPALSSNEPTVSEAVESIRRARNIVADTTYTPRTYTGDLTVKTLPLSSISRGCENVSRICTIINEYKVAFERRDRFKDRIIADIDRLVKEHDEPSEQAFSEVDRAIRTFANSVSGLIRRRSDFETSLCAYATGVCLSFVNYSEASLKRYAA